MNIKLALSLLLVACGTEAEESPPNGTAELELTYEPSSDSNAIMAPFVIGASTVSGDPNGALEIAVDEVGGIRHFTIALTGPLVVGQRSRRGMRYDEGGLRAWISDEENEFTGELTIERADAAGFSFSLTEHQLVPEAFTEAGAVVHFSGTGHVAFR